MATRVFLHIGTMKSATTAIQDLCDLNAARFAEGGLLWNGSQHNFSGFHDLLNTDERGAWTRGRWKRLEMKIRRHEGDALISNELLASLRRKEISAVVDALAPAVVHVVVSARDLGRVLPSQWQTLARNRETVTWKDYQRATLARRPIRHRRKHKAFWLRQDVADIVRRWSAHVPLERITVVTVPPSGSPPEVVIARFGSVVGIDVSTLRLPPPSNPSLGAHSAELLRRLNAKTKQFDPDLHRTAFKKSLARALEARRDVEPSFGLGDEEYRELSRRAETLVEELRALAMPVAGDLDDLIPVVESTDRELVDPGDSTAAELLSAAEYGIDHLRKAIASLSNERAALVTALQASGDADLVDLASVGSTDGPTSAGASQGSAEQRLHAAEDVIVHLAAQLGQVKRDYDALVAAVIAREPIVARGGQWRAFVAADTHRGRDVSAGTRRGRFVRWRLEQGGSGPS